MKEITLDDIPSPKNIVEDCFTIEITDENIEDVLNKCEDLGWVWMSGNKMHSVFWTDQKYLILRSCGRAEHCGRNFYNKEIHTISHNIKNKFNVSSPRNNDGRDVCFWCNVATQKRGGGAYDVCPKCGR